MYAIITLYGDYVGSCIYSMFRSFWLIIGTFKFTVSVSTFFQNWLHIIEQAKTATIVIDLSEIPSQINFLKPLSD